MEKSKSNVPGEEQLASPGSTFYGLNSLRRSAWWICLHPSSNGLQPNSGFLSTLFGPKQPPDLPKLTMQESDFHICQCSSEPRMDVPFCEAFNESNTT